jgi:uncharacterized protein (DUF305 family)
MSIRRPRSAVLCAVAALSAACAGSTTTSSNASGPGPAIVQPGAPGQQSRSYSTQELAAVEGVSYSPADVSFLQGMIPHHAQALEMTALVRQHATTNAVKQMGLRMEISQRDEIALMETWLRDHGEPITMPGMSGMAGMHMMPGMLTPEQMRTLANARGVEFDRLFLEYMIQHHQGAVQMVAKLFATSGAGQESTIFKFAEDVDADQTMEIQRMQGILATLR